MATCLSLGLLLIGMRLQYVEARNKLLEMDRLNVEEFASRLRVQFAEVTAYHSTDNLTTIDGDAHHSGVSIQSQRIPYNSWVIIPGYPPMLADDSTNYVKKNRRLAVQIRVPTQEEVNKIGQQYQYIAYIVPENYVDKY